MAMLLGGTFVSSVVSEEVYDPVYDTPMDANFIYQLLPSFYRTVMQDQELFSTVWSGMLQNQAADLLNLWQIDYAKSLRDVPVLAQRKWLQLDLYREEAFTVDPQLSTAGLGGTAFVHNADTRQLDATPLNRARWDKAFLQLQGTALEDTVDEATSLAWSIDVNVTSAQTFCGVLFGYFGSSSGRLSNTLAVAILGSETLADTPAASILHFDPSGIPTVSIGSFILEIGVDYRFDTTYTAGTGAVVLSIVELRQEKLASTSGEIGPGFGAVFTNQLTDDSLNFDTEGIVVGDILVAFGLEFDILSVDGSTITVAPIGLPVNVEDASYQILGEVEVGSLSLDLPGDASDPTFSVGQFGVSSLDSRSVTALVFSAPALARKKQMQLTVDNWRFLDPTVEETILSLPRVQERIVDPQVLQYEGTDYNVTVLDVANPDTAPSTLKFQEPPLEPLWAEYVAYDEQYIRNNFGRNVGLEDISSDQYKARVRGLYYAYFQGPTLAAIRIGVHILLGLPIAEVAGTVQSINPAFSGLLGLITVADRDYLYPLVVGTDLSVGDEVGLFAPLSLGVEVIDYITDPEWFVASEDIGELQKYHSFQVAMNLDAFDIETLSLAGTFVDQIKPTWKQRQFLVFKNLVDDVDISDVITIGISLNLYDIFCDTILVAYDDDIFEATEEDWKYSQGIADWDATSAAMRATSEPLAGTVVINNGDTVVTGTGTTWLTDIGGPGAVSNKFVAVGLYTAGSAGETTASSFLFIDNTANVFDDLLVDDKINITGEGTFEIQSIDRNVFSSGTGKFTTTTAFDDATATFLTDGIQVGDVLVPVGGPNDGLEFVVSSVPLETRIIISGTATVALIDSGAADFTSPTVFEESGALWQTNGVQAGDILVIGGAGPNAGSEFAVGLVVNEETLTIFGIASVSAAEPYTIERRATYTVERENQLTLDGPLGFSNTGVAWNVTGALTVWSEVVDVASDTALTFGTPFPGLSKTYSLALLDNAYRQVFYDQFEELCPDERFTIELEYTNGAAPGVTTVPDTNPALTTTFNFAVIGDTYTVTLDEQTP